MLLLQLVLGLAIILLGGLLIRWSLAAKSVSGIIVGGGLLLIVAVLATPVYLHYTAVGRIDWNPLNISRSDVSGEWSHEDSILTLRSDSTFAFQSSGESAYRFGLNLATGSWKLNDWNLTLQPDNSTALEMRVVLNGNAYRIVEQPVDLDDWRPWDGFSRSGL